MREDGSAVAVAPPRVSIPRAWPLLTLAAASAAKTVAIQDLVLIRDISAYSPVKAAGIFLAALLVWGLGNPAKTKSHRARSVLLYLTGSGYLFVQVIYHHYFNGFFTFSFLAGNLSESVRTLGAGYIPWTPAALLAFADLPFLAWYAASRRAWDRRPLVILPVLVAGLWAYTWTATSVKYKPYYWSVYWVRYFGFAANEVAALLPAAPSIEYGESLEFHPRPGKAPNLVLVQVESLDSNMLEAAPGGVSVMPRLRALAARGRYFPYVLSYHTEGGTSDIEFAVLNSGLDRSAAPSLQGAKDFPNSIIPVLRERYAVRFFHGNDGDFWGRNEIYRRMGLAPGDFRDSRAMGRVSGVVNRDWKMADAEVYRHVREAAARESGPFAYYVITLSSHGPFKFVDKYSDDGRFDDFPDGKLFKSMAYVDSTLADFVEEMLAIPDTCVIVFGDHAPGKVRNTYYASSVAERGGEALEFVPLLALGPGIEPAADDGLAHGLLDLAPTILGLARFEGSHRALGRNLLDPAAEIRRVPTARGASIGKKDLRALAESTRYP